MRAILNLRVWTAIALFVGIAMFFGWAGGRAFDHEYDKRIQRLEILACGLTQFEDLSVMVQADDRSRQMCADYILGRIDCDRTRVADSEYLVNCREK